MTLKNENKSNFQSNRDAKQPSIIVMESQELLSNAESVPTLYNVKYICILLLISFSIGLIVLCFSIKQFVNHFQETKALETIKEISNNTFGVDEGLLI